MVVRLVPRARASLALVWLLLFVIVVPITHTGAAPLDAEAELRVVKTAYDDIRTYYYTTPDTVALLTNAHAAAETALGQALPLDPLDGSDDQKWEVFAQNVRTMIGQSTVTNLASGDLAHKLVQNFAKTVGDEHTYFISKQQADATRREERGDSSIVNFGFTSVNVGSDVYVKQVVPKSAVDEGGLRNSDHILALNGQPVTSDTRATLFGSPQEGQTYTIAVQHLGDAGPTDLTVHIHRYTRLALVSRVLNGHIGYIQTFSFFTDIPTELDNALADLNAQHVDSIIFDLRGNGGGTATDQVMGRFVAGRTQLGVSKGRKSEFKLVAQSDGHAPQKVPVIVLIDETSASASEISALAFHEFTDATLIGTKTAGALGSTRRFDLGDGSLISITTSVYTSAKGADLNTIGVSPDVTVERTKDDIVAGRDPQFDAAVAGINLKVQLTGFATRFAA